ncbi:MAG TPA: ATP phosphoribosyltransferase regulatory subunit [Burkholderiaceae bacterium]|jgi:ATP phosphoribosyltransferase regulatory subunit|nr:ATP phosphoribosyltransferase regulatory subunit [Burkholderiaceae bacterium]
MTSAWLLPEHIADVLPSQARRIEELRRAVLDTARSYGYELVMPPLLEHIESLLSGAGRELDLRTFKLVDQLSGRTLGLRADTTPQTARIDAHLLNRAGMTRLCYCGPVLHTRPAGPQAGREPLQFGAEIYGHPGLEADLEVLDLALDCLERSGVAGLVLDLADVRIVRGLLAGIDIDSSQRDLVYAALARKDAPALREAVKGFPADARNGLIELLSLYGDAAVLREAANALPQRALIANALRDLQWLAQHTAAAHPSLKIGFDLADLSGYAYYSGARFAVYGAGSSDSLVRGGRYDEVGAVFGRNRAAVGFSTDLKALVELSGVEGRGTAILAPWGEDAALRATIRELREQGHIVVCVLPGHEHEVQEFDCDREIVRVNGQWTVRALPA